MIEERIKVLDELGMPFGIPQSHKDSIELGMEEARDYYDAQIDAQAKTMEELLKMAIEGIPLPVGIKDKASKLWNDSQLAEYGDKLFHMIIAGFLAAGGTIKDGES